MEPKIHGQNISVGDHLDDHVRRQMEFALGQFDSWISSLDVHLEDVNGPKGGVDKQCRIVLGLKGGRTIKVQDIDVDMTVAINRAADRLSHVVSRETEKRREKK